MSKETYSIPKSPAERYDFQRNAITAITTNATAWSVPAAKVTALGAARTAYEPKYFLASNRSTKSPAATAGRDATWEPLEVLLIDVFDHHLVNNVAISAADKEALGIHSTIGGTGVPSPAPTTAPIINLLCEEISVLHVVYADASNPSSHSKPQNVAFCEVCYKIGEIAPLSVEECTLRQNVARSHEGIVFAPEQRGKAIHLFARWVNKNGKTGPWSNMVTALIP